MSKNDQVAGKNEGGRPRESGLEEARFAVRLRLDNDPVVRRFYDLLEASDNRMALLREAIRVYMAYLDGDLGQLTEQQVGVEEPVAEDVSLEDIFEF